MTTPDILCLGEPLVEFVRDMSGDGRMFRQGIGGDTSNAAISAARQGASVGYLTALGDDRFGAMIRALWAHEGVDARHVVTSPTAPTGLYFIEPDPAERFFTYYRDGSAASLMTPADLPHPVLQATKVLHLSGITLAVSATMRATALAAAALVAAAGGAVSLDTNLRLKLWPVEEAREVIHAAMAHARIAVTSIDDSADLTGLTDPAAIADFYQSLGPQIVLVTMGAEGVWLATPEGGQPIPAAPADPVDSTGAGDSFAGAFLAWWLETGDAIKAARAATIVAAGTVSGLGAVDPILRRADVLSRMSES